MKKLGVYQTAAVGAIGVLIASRLITARGLVYFKPSEFGLALPFLSSTLLLKLDDFRAMLGYPVEISPAKGALIRFDTGSESQHAIGYAADVLIPGIVSPQAAYDVAKAVGFGGVGVAPVGVWHPSKLGLHLDIRPTDAKWGYTKTNGIQKMVAVSLVGVNNA